jgi:regulator of sirC expression with transglutaminase-like and TPR domain
LAAPGPAFAVLQRQLSQPDATVDFAAAKLTTDRLIDPTIDVDAAMRELDKLTHAITSRSPAGLSPRERMDILLSTLYTAGPWNDQRPFTYDLDDPLGRDLNNKLLSTYLHTRKGNCVSMPILVAILGQKVGLTVTLSTAPLHTLVKFADGNAWLNVEATAGGYKWDSSYERDLEISALAIENQIYLRPLTPREAAGAIAATLMEDLAAKKRADDLMTVADMLLAVNPKDVVAIIQKANAYSLQVDQQYRNRYPRPIDIPPELQADYAMRAHANLEWFAKAEALGWTPATAQNQARYLQSVDQEKAKREHP